MKHYPFIASYPGDYEWLSLCLKTFHKHGAPFFQPPMVCVASEDFDSALEVCQDSHPFATVCIFDAVPGPLRAQACMINSDCLVALDNPETDYIYFVGSDCCLTGTPTLSSYFTQQEDGTWLPDLFINSYDHLLDHGCDVKRWQTGTSRHVGYDVTHEFMRRLPLAYSKRVLDGTRRHLEKIHNTSWLRYLVSIWEAGDFSESNVIGAWAWRHRPFDYHWVDRDPPGRDLYEVKFNPLKQFWSHGGLDRPADGSGEIPRSWARP